MFVTLEVSKLVTSKLIKLPHPLNINLISVTCDVSKQLLNSICWRFTQSWNKYIQLKPPDTPPSPAM